jgi:transcriptional regulator with XRE-family HTH domain
MNDQILDEPTDVAQRIARLVEERGWNQDEFARQAGLNRQTVREILQATCDRRPRNDTISRCARALGVTVNELRHGSFDRLLTQMACLPEKSKFRLYEEATQPELNAWLLRNPERASQLQPKEIDELLSLQGTGGPLTSFGVEHFVDLIERRREILEQVHAIANTEYLGMLEEFISLLYEKIQPYRDRR